MKIIEVADEYIKFDNGNSITYDHERDCCETNWADFEQLDDVARAHNFSENIIFEAVEESGFRFGDKKAMFFVPCYSDQNGYYSSSIDIYYNNVRVLAFEAEMRKD